MQLTQPGKTLIQSDTDNKSDRQTDKKANIRAGENLTNLHATQPGQTVGQSGRDKLY